MVGVILCGGQSVRMGNDKGLLSSEGITWAEAAVGKLSALKIPVCISVNEQQYDVYAKTFDANLLVKDNPALQIHGPLSGVLSTHLEYPLQNIFVLACDMPLMEIKLLNRLYNADLETDDYDAYIFTNNEEAEPLCGIYCAKGLAFILDTYNKGLLAKHSMKFMLDNLNVHFIELTNDEKKYFKNLNTHADINGD